MKLFSISKKGNFSNKDTNLKQAYALIEDINRYLNMNDIIRASQNYSELENVYRTLESGKEEIFKKSLELRARIDKSPKIEVEISEDVKAEPVELIKEENINKELEEQRKAEEQRNKEMLTNLKIGNEKSDKEIKRLKKELEIRDKVLDDISKRNEFEKKRADRNLKKIKHELHDIKNKKSSLHRELKFTKRDYEKRVSKLESQIKKIESDKPKDLPKVEKVSKKKKMVMAPKLKIMEKIKSIKLPKSKKNKILQDVPHELPKLNQINDAPENKNHKKVKSVPKVEWLKLGVPGFDELITNGIPKGSSVLVAGGPGSGKTTLCLQTIAFGANHGEKCLYLTFEESKVNLMQHMKDFGWDPIKLEKQGKLLIRKMDPFEISRNVEALLAKASGELMIDIDEVEGIIPPEFKPDRIVLDSLSAVAAAFTGKEEGYRIYIEQLFSLFKKIGATSFLITEIEQDTTKYSRSGVEEFLADVVISLYSIRKGSVKVSAIEIIKIRGTKFKKKIVPFKMITNKGIEVYPQEEVFA